MLTSLTRTLNLPLDGDRQTGWKPYPLFSGSTSFMDFFSGHVSVLSSGIIPHQPHAHVEEELLIMISGEVDLVIPDTVNGTETRTTIRPGGFVYYPAYKRHTIHNASPEPATYLMFKWSKEGSPEADGQLETTILSYKSVATDIDPKPAQGVVYREILDGPTAYLTKLQSHVTTLQQGSGYQPHSDEYDVAILLLRGAVQTLGRKVEAHSVIFYAAGEPHGMINLGDCNAFYLVFEFHGRERDVQDITGQDRQAGIFEAQNRKIAEKEKMISELNEQNAELKARLQTIELSLTWQMTMLYHNRIVESCFPVGSRRRNSYDLAIEGVRILINEGSGTFWHKFKKHFRM